MEDIPPQQRPAIAPATARTPWILTVAGVALFHGCWYWQGNEEGFWLPGLGLGISLVSWLGWRVLPLLFVDLLLVRSGSALFTAQPWSLLLGDTSLHIAQIGLSWWLYHHVAGGSRWLDDPRSATVFLILVPGAVAALFAVLETVLWLLLWDMESTWESSRWVLTARLWLSRMVGILVVVPLLLVMMTPLLMRLQLVLVELPTSFFGETQSRSTRQGDWIELIGLTFATAILALLLLWTHIHSEVWNWTLWGCCLILIVWTCIRQGLRGGSFAAGITSMTVLTAAQMLPEDSQTLQSPMQGNLLAFCSTALLVGVSSSWVRANEARYRHVVAQIPVVLYSARLPYGLPSLVAAEHTRPTRDSKRDMNIGPSISKMASVLLVSPACQEIYGCPPEKLLGPFTHWLDQILAEDHELVIAALAQLCLQKQPVTCEYRIRQRPDTPMVDPALQALLPRSNQAQQFRWVRETLTPHYSAEGMVDGWEGLVEEVTQQRALSQNLRKLTNMLQVLITNLPTGVFFVQGPNGYPLLVNARARQLLGQREDMSAGLAHLSRIYRLHRPDGKEYPADELPISKALRLGATCRANDIIVHRADGRKIPLIAWAAPIDLNNTGIPDAAVWVLEDLSAMQQAESALRESEIRLRAVIETMGEGVIVQDERGMIIECNPSACAILESSRDQLLSQQGLAPAQGCLQENGLPLPHDEHPDQRALRSSDPVGDVILGLPIRPNGTLRWLHVNSMPLPMGPGGGLNHQKARVVTTFADITQQMQFQESVRAAKEKYQDLVESLPFMMIQQDREFNITYQNPAAISLTGYTPEQLAAPDFYRHIIVSEDWPVFQAAAQQIDQGQSTRIELHLIAQDQTRKSVLAFMHPHWHEGTLVGSTSLLMDITTQRRLEEELLRAKHLELVGKIASGTVHDFNNLLAVMMSLAELARMEIPGKHAAQPHLMRLIDVGEQASHLAGQILAFGKQRSKIQRPVDLNLTVMQTIRLLRSVMPMEIVVEPLLLPDLPLIRGNEHQLKQVLMNLCLNARDAMPQGGLLTIRTDMTSPPTVQFVLPANRQWVHLSIQDTGQGMDENTRQRIFEPFFSTKERGTGLGLAVVQQIIQEFGGHLDVWSQLQVGTRMDIWLVQSGND